MDNPNGGRKKPAASKGPSQDKTHRFRGFRNPSVGICALALLVYTFHGRGGSGNGSGGYRAPPETYALCSRDGNHIYTVDAQNSKTQCIVVHESFIVDTGVLRKFRANPPTSWKCPDLFSRGYPSPLGK